MALTKVSLVDLNAGELILDLNADTSITADTDDTIHFKIGGSDEITITGTALSPSTSDGNALGTAALEWSDLFLADGAVINFGDDQDVSLTHVADSGLLLSSTDKLMFNDASQFIQGVSATVLDIAATDEIELTSTLIDVVGNLAVSGTIVGAGALTAATSITVGSAVLTEAELETLDGVTVGTAIASKVVTTDANIDTTGQRNLTISGELDAATGDFSGDVDIDGTANLDTVDIDGATQIDATVTVGVDDTGYDVKFFGDTSGAHMLWDASVDDLILAGAGRLVVPEGNLVLGSTAVTSTPAEINLIDGGATVGTTAVADGDGLLHNDNGTMRVTSAATFKTYFQEGISTAYDDLTTGDAAVLITTSSGNITIDAAANDSDIILKGTDGGADTTFLTIDGSAAGEATFNAGVIAPALTIDDVAVDGKVITMTGSSGDTFVTTVAANGATSLVTTDAAAAAAHLQITADGTVDIDGTTITLDSAGDIVLDAGGDNVFITYAGTNYLDFQKDSNDVQLVSRVSDGDMVFRGNDGGSIITALTLDMSAAGAATFNDKITAVGTSVFTNLDISGDIDVDGTSNLDVVDIDGAVDMASTLQVDGAATLSAALQVDGTITTNDTLTVNGAAVFNENSADVDFRVETNGDTHAFFVDGGDGYVSINNGPSSPQLRALPGGESNGLQIKGNSASSASMAITRHSNDAAGPALRFLKSRNTTVNSFSIVGNTDVLGALEFYGDDGVDYATPGASITAKVNGTAGGNDLPTELIFSTTTDGAAAVADNMKIKSDGRIELTAGKTSFLAQTTATDGTWNFDNTTASTVACAAGASVAIGNTASSGFFIINETTQSGATAIVVTGGGILEIVEQTASNFEGTSTPGTNKIGLFLSSSKVVAKNNYGGSSAIALSMFTFRTRSAQ